MADTFGDFGTPTPPPGPPTGGPMPGDAASAAASADAIKKLTESVKEFRTKTEVAVERIVDLSAEGNRLQKSLKANYEDLKKIEDKTKLGLKLTDEEIKRQKELAALEKKEKEELLKITESLVKLRDSLESSEEVQHHASESLKLFSDALEDYSEGIPRQLSEMEKELKPVTEWANAQKDALQGFSDSIKGVATSLPSFKDSLKAGFALGMGKLIPLIADSFSKAKFGSIQPLNLASLFGKKEEKKSEISTGIETLSGVIKEESKASQEWLNLLVDTISPIKEEIKSLTSVQEWLDLLATSLGTIEKDIKAVVASRPAGGMTAVVEGGGDMVAEYINLLIDEVKEIRKVANSIVGNTVKMTASLLEMKDALIDAVIAQQESALDVSEKERAGPVPPPAPAKPGEKATAPEAAPPKGKLGSFMSAAKEGAQALLMIAGSLVVLAIGLKLMKDVDPTTLIKTGIAMTGLGAGLFFLSKLNSVDLKRTAMSMLIVASSITVLALGMMLMKNVGVESFIKTGVALVGMVGALKLLSQVDSTKLMKSALSLGIVGASIIPLALGLKLMASVSVESMLKTGAAILGLVGILYAVSKIDAAGVLKGALAIAIMGTSLIPMAAGLLMMNMVSWESVGKMATALVGLSLAALAIGQIAPQILLGALAIAALGVAMIPLALGMLMFSMISWETMGMAAVAIVGFALAAAGLGFIAPFILAGAAAIGALGLALMPFGLAMNMLGGIGIDAILQTAAAIGVFAGIAAGLGFIAPLVIFGSAAIGALGLALIPLAMGLTLVTPAIEAFVGVIQAAAEAGAGILERFADIGMNGFQIGAGLVAAAAGIGAVGLAIAAFTALSAASQVGGAIAGIASSVLSFFSGGKSLSGTDMLGLFMSFAEVAPKLSEGAAAINNLATALQNFANIKFEKMSGLDVLTSFIDKVKGESGGVFDKLKSMGQSLMAFAVAQPPPTQPAKSRSSIVEYAGEEYELPSAKDGDILPSNLQFRNGVLMTPNVSTSSLIAEANVQKRRMEMPRNSIERELSETLLRQILSELQTRGAIQPVVVNNTTAVPTTPPPSGGGGGGIIPLYSGSHTDPTKVAYQVSFRPAG